MEVLVGTGGWDYLPLEVDDRLRAYADRFRYVEVNSSFYHIPRLSTVRSWRRRVPRDFVFSVKCSRQVTHDFALRPLESTFRALERMRMVCRLLRSEMLVLQTPPSLSVDEEVVKTARTLVENTGLDELNVFWDARSPSEPRSRKLVHDDMLRQGITPVTDLSVEDPLPGVELVYSRMFDRAPGLFGDETLERIRERVKGSTAEKVVLTFHGSSMYRDASRYLSR